MLFRGSISLVADNSGAKKARCIGFYKSIKCSFITVNQLLRVCIKKFKRRKFLTGRTRSGKNNKLLVDSKIIKSSLLYRAMLITSRRGLSRIDGTSLFFKKNRIVLFSDVWKILGKRIKGPILREIRKKRRRVTLYKEVYEHSKRRI